MEGQRIWWVPASLTEPDADRDTGIHLIGGTDPTVTHIHLIDPRAPGSLASLKGLELFPSVVDLHKFLHECIGPEFISSNLFR